MTYWVEWPSDDFVGCREGFAGLGEALAFAKRLRAKDIPCVSMGADVHV